MKKIYKLFSLLFVLISFITLASCSSGPGVNAVMEYTASATKIKITCTFEANSKLETGEAVPAIRQYSYDSDGNEKYDENYKKVTFDKSNTTSTVEFVGLERNTKYLFKLYVTYESVDTYITEIEATTANYDDDTPIEIASTADFIKMEDDREGNYILTKDLDFSDVSSSDLDLFSTESTPFEGTFNGNGHTISNYSLTNNSTKFYGIFGYTKKATISNLNVNNVTLDSTNRGTFSAGALIGQADSTKVDNVKIDNVNFTIGFSSSEENVGGVVGLSNKSSFTKTEVTNFEFNSNQLRGKLNIGLFAGEITGDSISDKVIEGTGDVATTDECKATGKITGVIKNTTSNDGFIRIGGFVGHISASTSYVYNSYAVSEILVTKVQSSGSVEDNFDFYVGGFLGSNDGVASIYKCFAKSSIEVYAGSKIDSETSQEDIEKISKTPLCNKMAYAGGFAGKFSFPVGEIKDCYFAALYTYMSSFIRDASNVDRAYFERIKGEKIENLPVNTTLSDGGIEYEITGQTNYYTIDAGENFIDEETFNAGTYYVLEDDNYKLAEFYDEAATYYTLNATDVTDNVNSNTDFSGKNYYVLNGYDYEVASSYTKKAMEVSYFLRGSIAGYSYPADPAKIDNVGELNSGSDLTKLEEYVRTYVESLFLN